MSHERWFCKNDEYNKKKLMTTPVLRFRSYVYLQNKSEKEISLNHWFYVSALKQTTARMETFTSQLYSGDFIYF